MIIKNASVYMENGTFVEQDIYIEGEKIVSNATGEVIDAAECFAIPGLTDIHFHGCMGYDFCDGTIEAITRIAEYEASVGVTTMVPATMTLPEEQLMKICQTAAKYNREMKDIKGASLVGINMEGPYLAISKKGAQNGNYIKKPDALMYDRLNKACDGLFKLVAIAPEEEGAIDFIKEKKQEVVLSLAHTAAGYEEAIKGFKAGITHVTHMYNAMNGLNHRNPGPIAAAADMGAEVELICDGVHIHPSIVRLTFKMMGENKIIFVSDTMEAVGLKDGIYSLGGQEVHVKENLATLKDGTIAGSATNLLDCLRYAVQKIGISLETAVKCAAVNSAKSVGIYDQYGSITPGKYANIILLRKEDLSLKKVILRGTIL